MRSTRRLHGLGAVAAAWLLASALAVPCSAQSARMRTYAWLWLNADRDGDVVVSLMLPAEPGESGAVREGLDRMLGARIDLISRFNQDTRFYGIAHGALGRKGFELEGDVDFAQLTQALAVIGIDELQVYLRHPASATPAVLPVVGERSERWARFTLDTHAAPVVWHWAFGFPSASIRSAVTKLALLFVVPLILLVVLRLRALGAGNTDPATAWFNHWRATNAVVLGTWLVWPLTTVSLHIASLFEWLVPHWLETLLGSALHVGPPALVTLAAAALGHAVTVRARGLEWTFRETMGHTVRALAAFVVPFVLLWTAVALLGLGEPRVAIALLILGVVLAVVLGQRSRKALEITPHAVTTGPLRDRLFELAARANVKLDQIFVLPMRRSRLANAFAVQGRMVMLTDVLLGHLSRREIDAIMAHEITHVQKGHPMQMVLASTVLGALGFLACTSASQFHVPLAVEVAVVVLAIAALLAFYRHNEGIADAGAVKLTGDPEAMIRGLARLGQLNRMPLEWGGISGLFLTHPSTGSRARAIGRAAGFEPARVAELLRAEPDGVERYEAPAGSERTKVFSSPFKVGTVNRNALAILLVCTLTPALVVSLARGAGWTNDTSWLVALVSLALTLFALRSLIDIVAVRPYAGLERALRQRAQVDGFDMERLGGTFVGFAPDPAPRVYEGFYDWDIGWLILDRDRLVYLGEETRFVLERGEVTAIEIGLGGPGWIRAPRLVVRWAAGERSGSFQLRPAAIRRLGQGVRAAQRLEIALRSWWQGEAKSAELAASWPMLESPSLGAVTSRSPRSLATLRASVFGVLLMWIGSLIVSVLLDLFSGGGWGVLTCVAVSCLAQLLLLAPAWMYRDPTDAARRGPSELSARRAA